MSPAYTFNMPNGVVGDVSRPDESNVEPTMLVTPFPSQYGLAMAPGTKGAQAWGAGNVQADFLGVLARAVPGIANDNGQAFNAFTPNQAEPQGLLVRGYINVQCQYGTPARNGIVYVCIAASAGRVIGGFEATSQGGSNVALTTQQAVWAVDGCDANLNSELRVAR